MRFSPFGRCSRGRKVSDRVLVAAQYIGLGLLLFLLLYANGNDVYRFFLK